MVFINRFSFGDLRSSHDKCRAASLRLIIYKDTQYDNWGNLATVAAPGNLVTTNLYDLRGRETQTTDPDLGLWKYEYNVLGELVKRKHQGQARIIP